MFVIRRKAGESVVVGQGIEIHVLEVGNNRVKLGFVAPPEVSVVRHEVLIAGKQNLAAADLPEQPLWEEWARALRLPSE